MRSSSPASLWATAVLALLVLLFPAGALAGPIQHDQLRFRSVIPEGFKPVPEAVKGDALFVYRREGLTGNHLGTIITFERLRGVIGREPLTLEQVRKNAPDATVTNEPWKSFTVQMIRREIEIQGKPAVAYSVQLPLKPEAIQISVAGDRSNDDSVSRVVRELVADTDGDSNWLTDGERSRRLGQGIGRMIGVALGLLAVIWLFRKLRS